MLHAPQYDAVSYTITAHSVRASAVVNASGSEVRSEARQQIDAMSMVVSAYGTTDAKQAGQNS